MASTEKSKDSWAARWQRWQNNASHALFEKIAAVIVVRPKTVLVVTFLVALLCTAGITRQKTETNPDQLFTPTESQAVDDEDWIDSVFVSGTRRVNVFFVAEPGNPTNLVDDATVKDTIKAVIETRALTFSFVAPCSSGLPCTFRPIPYSSVCVNATVRATGETACLAASVGDYFNNDVAEVDALTPLEVRQRLSDVNATDVFGRPLTRSSVMGGVEVDAAGVITSVEAFQLTGDVVFESVPIDGEPDGDPETISLEEYMYKELQDQDAAESRVRILPLTQAGQRESSGEAIGGDFNLFIAGYMLLFLYVLAVLFSRSWRHSRMTLAFAVLVSVMMAIGASFGLVGALGVKFNNVVTSLVVIIMGLGVDDAFVIMDNYDQVRDIPDLKQRMVVALGKAGASILATSSTDMIAFAAGTSTVLPAIRAFCIYAAVCIFADFVFQVTFFVACFYIDTVNKAKGRPDWWCCACRRTKPTPASTPFCGVPCCKPSPELAAAIDVVYKDAAAGLGGDDGKGGAGGASGASASASASATAAAGTDPAALAAAQDVILQKKVMQRVVGHWLPSVTLSGPGRIAVLVAAAAVLAAGVVGCTQLEVEFSLDWFATDSEINEIFDVRDKYFGQRLTAFLYTGNVNYFALQSEVADAVDAFQNCNGHIAAGSVVSWLALFSQWEVAEKGAASTTADGFYTNLQEFTASDVGRIAAGQVVFVDDADPTQGLQGSRFAGDLIWPTKALDQVDAMDDLRACIAPFPSLEPRVFSFFFLFTEGIAVIGAEMLQNLIVAGVAVLVVSMLLLANFYAAALVLLVIVSVDVCLLGFLHFTGYEVNSVTTVNIVLSVGLSVDYSLHIMHSFLVSNKGDRRARAAAAMEHLGRSVVNGGITTWLAVSVLAFSESYVFNVFFACFTLTIVFGQFFGVIVLPVVLSLIGPDPYEDRTAPPTNAVSDSHSGDIEMTASPLGKEKARVRNPPF